RSRQNLEAALGVAASSEGAWGAPLPAGLRRTQEHLFDDAVIEPAPPSDEVSVLSAPGESRECVELARLVRREAARGVPFDRMAILLRAPSRYRAHVEEALRRAKIPAHFASGSVRPDPSGRAFLALLSCAAEGLSARRFAEYLSLGEVPAATSDGAPPPAPPSAERWAPPDEELIADVITRAAEAPERPGRDDEPSGPVVQGSLRAPRRWERLLVDAAVIGGSVRWRRRLDGLAKELGRQRHEVEGDDARVGRIDRQLEDLACLRGFALPLIELLEGLPRAAVWREWIEHLSMLATRALRRPERVVSVLGELVPMAEVGPVELADVRLVLARRLTELVERPAERKFGRVYVAPVDAVRGLSFDVVFVPGLAERMFPEKVSEDPLLPDVLRARLSGELETNADRVHRERLALKLAIGAAERRLVLSYPRVDVEQARPRVPSFYGLEVLRASEGVLPGFDVLTRRAEQRGAARIGWPAPADPRDAIDEAEHDLALLDRLLHRPEEETIGTARYLLSVNPHLTRALRARARRWIKKWTPADGLVEPIPEARSALLEHAPSVRAYSATALEKLASCPYQFFLSAILRLAPRDEAEAIEELGPLERGQLIHQVQFLLFQELRTRGLLPLVPAALDDARHVLDRIVREVARSFEEELAPAIDRVWDDGISLVEADLREWLRRTSEERVWTPWRFELAFGLPAEHARERDADSRAEPVELDIGLRLRGSIDLVEKGPTGAVRATDHKTGKMKAKPGVVIGGGSTLQPVLYALALEKLLPGTSVDAGRLYYCTQTGDFQAVDIPLDERAREGARQVVETVGDLVDRAFFPAAPAKGACQYCDYRSVCGPHEEHRVTLKRKDALKGLVRLREAE
ncbi:PD-(D/E)XK nuclease family protein, partial [Myxococcota bacterium]|nr:PD-(D/E)XK nuclease family protein [Myxococcota bacterium]